MKKSVSILTLATMLLFAMSAMAADRVVVIPLFSGGTVSCPEGLTDCGGKCVDTANNPAYCGDCSSTCTAGQYCSNGVCVSHDGFSCTDSGECMSGNCVDGVCCDNSCTSTCESCLALNTGGTDGTCAGIIHGTDPYNECPGASFCQSDGSCSPTGKQIGETCTDPSECLTGFCVDGFCCDTSCLSLCESCSAAGTEGSCTLIPSGLDPDNECPGSSCSGTGTCL